MGTCSCLTSCLWKYVHCKGLVSPWFNFLSYFVNNLHTRRIGRNLRVYLSSFTRQSLPSSGPLREVCSLCWRLVCERGLALWESAVVVFSCPEPDGAHCTLSPCPQPWPVLWSRGDQPCSLCSPRLWKDCLLSLPSLCSHQVTNPQSSLDLCVFQIPHHLFGVFFQDRA